MKLVELFIEEMRNTTNIRFDEDWLRYKLNEIGVDTQGPCCSDSQLLDIIKEAFKKGNDGRNPFKKNELNAVIYMICLNFTNKL